MGSFYVIEAEYAQRSVPISGKIRDAWQCGTDHTEGIPTSSYQEVWLENIKEGRRGYTELSPDKMVRQAKPTCHVILPPASAPSILSPVHETRDFMLRPIVSDLNIHLPL